MTEELGRVVFDEAPFGALPKWEAGAPATPAAQPYGGYLPTDREVKIGELCDHYGKPIVIASTDRSCLLTSRDCSQSVH